MFCMKCGHIMSDDACFCSACGTPVNHAVVQEAPVYTPQPAAPQPIMQEPIMQQPIAQQPVMQPVSEPSDIPSEGDEEAAAPNPEHFESELYSPAMATTSNSDWNAMDFYHSIQVDTKDLPDIQGEYLVLDDARIRLSEIVTYTWDNTKFIFGFVDANQQQLSVDFSAKGKGALKAALSVVSIVGAVAGVSPVYYIAGSSYNKGKIERFYKQLMRIAPLCGNEFLQFEGHVAVEMMSALKNAHMEDIFRLLGWSTLLDHGEYPVYVSHTCFMTNQYLVFDADLAFKLDNLPKYKMAGATMRLLDEKGKPKKGKSGKKLPPIPFTKADDEVLNKLVMYYNLGHVDEFIEKEFTPNSGIMQRILRLP